MHKHLVRAIGIALIVNLSAAVTAQPSPAHPRSGDVEHAPAKPAQSSKAADQRQQYQAPQSKSRSPTIPYGTWKKSWGKKPSPPPKHWSKTNDWHRHVRACQLRYKSYRAQTDTFRTYSGKTLICKL